MTGQPWPRAMKARRTGPLSGCGCVVPVGTRIHQTPAGWVCQACKLAAALGTALPGPRRPL
jgi:hypothetical protein